MIARPLLLAIALLAASAATASAQSPRRRPRAAHAARQCQRHRRPGADRRLRRQCRQRPAQIAIYRAPDLGTTGTLPVAQVIAALRAHQVIGVATSDIKEITVTRLARTLDGREIELAVAARWSAATALATPPISASPSTATSAMSGWTPPTPAACSRSPSATMPRNSRFDVTFEIANETGAAPARLRFTGTAIETVEAAVLARGVERDEMHQILRRAARAPPEGRSRQRCRQPRPRGRHAGAPPAARRPGAQGRRSRQARSRAARPERHADLRVHRALSHHARQGDGRRHRRRRRQRDEPAIQAHRAGVVIGRGQVTITVAPPRLAPETTSSLDAAPSAAPVSVANVNPAAAAKAE